MSKVKNLISKRKRVVFLSLLLSLLFSTGVLVYAIPSLTSTTADRDAIAYTWTFYEQGDYDCNCLGYAVGYNYTWVWPWGSGLPTSSQVDTYMKMDRGYVYNVNAPTGGCKVYSYGSPSGITHFSKKYGTSGYGTVAKWGNYEIFTAPNTNPYKASPYGPIVKGYY